MRGHLKFMGRALVVALVVAVCVSGAWKVLTLKAADSEDTSASFENFYELEEDSVDVLFMGSSHVFQGFVPQELYDGYGITSYNLGSSGQSIVLTYYWLEEALETQSPEVVVLDVYKMFSEGLGCTEGNVRKALDYMRWGPAKVGAVEAVCELDESLTEISFYLPNVRYHDRWKELTVADFTSDEVAEVSEYYGYYYGYPSNYVDTPDEEFTPLVEGVSDEVAELAEPAREYLDRIVGLCEEEGIELVLVKTPAYYWTAANHNAIVAYAEEHGLDFYDLNEEELYEELGFELYEDTVDGRHANLAGALKITDYVGGLLSEEYGLEAHESAGWEEGREDYEKMADDYWLSSIDDAGEYLEALAGGDDRYAVFIAVKGDASAVLGDGAVAAGLEGLGLSAGWEDAEGCSYLAVVDEGEVLCEELSSEALEFTGSFQDGRLVCTVSSTGDLAGDAACDIMLEGSDEDVGGAGLNIVVYSNERQCVVDSVCFQATDDGEVVAVR